MEFAFLISPLLTYENTAADALKEPPIVILKFFFLAQPESLTDKYPMTVSDRSIVRVT